VKSVSGRARAAEIWRLVGEIADLVQCRQSEHEPTAEIGSAEPRALLAAHGYDAKGWGGKRWRTRWAGRR
jgi:hypothetical protein